MERIVCLVIGYIFGLFQTGYLYGKAHHVDIRKQGSGNAGTTNALRTMGWKAGAVTFLGDCFKCVFAVVVVHLLFARNSWRHSSASFYVCRNGCGAWTQLSVLHAF